MRILLRLRWGTCVDLAYIIWRYIDDRTCYHNMLNPHVVGMDLWIRYSINYFLEKFFVLSRIWVITVNNLYMISKKTVSTNLHHLIFGIPTAWWFRCEIYEHLWIAVRFFPLAKSSCCSSATVSATFVTRPLLTSSCAF